MNNKYNIDNDVVHDLYFNKNMSLLNIGKKFGVGPDAIRGIFNRNKWQTRTPYKQKLDKNKVINLYNNGASGTEIANKFSVDQSSVYKLLSRNNINITQGEKNRKHRVNKNFFSKWSPLMAYWLGMLCADGHISKSNNFISLSSKDIDHLRLFSKDLESDYKVKSVIRGDKSFSPGTIQTLLRINSIKVKNDLLKLGVHDFKNGGLELVNKIPNNLFSHWLRGMTDGDGTISIINSTQGQYPTWRLVGPYKEQLRIIGEKTNSLCNISKLSVYKSKTIFVITCKKRKCVKLLHYLYKDNIRSLKRKELKFETIRNKFYTNI